MTYKKNGRPTKFKTQYSTELLDFFSLDPPSYRECANKQGTIQMIARTMPTLERFAISIGVSSRTLYEWSSATKKGSNELLHPEFSLAYARAKDCQMAYILEAGIVGALSGSFLNLFMKNAHGWTDKVEEKIEHSNTIDLKQIDEDLRIAGEIKAEKYNEMVKSGLAGKYRT